MPKHASLTARLMPLNSKYITPHETMARNERCWCLSGKKFKHCHYVRETLKPVNAFEQEQRLFEELREGYCSLSNLDTCSSSIAKAHTIQRKGGLSAISEDHHVLTVKPVMKEMIKSKGNPQPRKVGIKSASVFPGFCSKHDSEVFKLIEGKSLEIDLKSAFLLSYRAIAYERYSKEAEGRFNAILQEEADRGKPFRKQAEIQSLLYGVSIGIELGKSDVNRVKGEFDKLLLSDSFEDFHFCAVRFDMVLPVVACCAFHPEFDLKGNQLQQLGQNSVELDSVTLTVTAFEEHTIAVFGWIGADDGPARSLSNSLLETEDARRADALIRLLFIHSDNIFLNPTWWNDLPDKQKSTLNEMTRSGTIARRRTRADYADESLDYISAKTVETIVE